MTTLRFVRRFVGLFAIAAVIGGPSNIALADTTVDFTLNAVSSSGVCSLTTSAGGSVDVHRVSNGGASFWEPISASGPMALTFDTTGAPGDRNCYSTASNTDFANAAGTVTLVGASALSMTPSNGGMPVYVGSTAPHAFVNVENIATGGQTVDLTWYIISNGPPNPNAPAGTYTSTLTITLSNTNI